MTEAVIAGGIVLLLVAGSWWTRGFGGVPGGIDDPASEELRRFSEPGDRVPQPAVEREDRDRETEPG